MRTIKIGLVLFCFELFLMACSPVQTPIVNHFKLDSYSKKCYAPIRSKYSIQVSTPEAAAGYAVSDMLYVKKPFALTAFAKNSWVEQPADMLLPLIIQSLEQSGYFFAVTSSAYSEKTDYRLDTQLIKLEQNFLTVPSHIDFVAKLVLTQMSNKRVLSSRLISIKVNCPMDTPYGGVIAANQATRLFTAQLTHFVISLVKCNSLPAKTN